MGSIASGAITLGVGLLGAALFQNSAKRQREEDQHRELAALLDRQIDLLKSPPPRPELPAAPPPPPPKKTWKQRTFPWLVDSTFWTGIAIQTIGSLLAAFIILVVTILSGAGRFLDPALNFIFVMAILTGAVLIAVSLSVGLFLFAINGWITKRGKVVRAIATIVIVAISFTAGLFAAYYCAEAIAPDIAAWAKQPTP